MAFLLSPQSLKVVTTSVLSPLPSPLSPPDHTPLVGHLWLSVACIPSANTPLGTITWHHRRDEQEFNPQTHEFPSWLCTSCTASWESVNFSHLTHRPCSGNDLASPQGGQVPIEFCTVDAKHTVWLTKCQLWSPGSFSHMSSLLSSPFVVPILA